MTNIVYMGIARPSVKLIVADYAAVDTRDNPRGRYEEKLNKVMNSGRVDQHNRLTIADKDVGSIHYDADPALLYMVITAPSYPQRTAFRLLSEARAEFEKAFESQMAGAKSGALTKAAKPTFMRLMAKYEDAAKADKIANVSLQVDEVKGVMQNNIQAALKNQENLETLLDSSDTMKNEASSFNRSTNRVKENMQWRNTKMKMFLAVLVLVLAAVLLIPFLLRKREK